MILFLRLLLLVLVALVVFVAWIYVRQDRMIYHPRPYRDDHLAMVPLNAVKLEYDISCGRQTAWYVPPRAAVSAEDRAPERLWMLFGGNGSLALFWSDVIEAAPDNEAGYLMFDYPGYGHCEGSPSPASMEESGDAAIIALAKHLGLSHEELKLRKIRLLGHSLGAAVALAFAERHLVDRVVLVAPFTTMRDMADKAVSPWLGWLLRHNFDNKRALATLAKRDPQPAVIVTHGVNDGVIPVDMARTLAREWPDMVDYIEVENANHQSILDGVEKYMGNEFPPLTAKALENAATLSAGEKNSR